MTEVETAVLPVVWTSQEIQKTKYIFYTKILIINIRSHLLSQITQKKQMTHAETIVLPVVLTLSEI